ncbi:VOC family protein [Haloarcula sp. GH36]|uniref:VOC family protein n=1 Tax=Haloarcula montana TaxID=3111776 RepID=UPI002D77FB96|nr:VOC family protein [Haloarcula sp. GH36]
MAADSPQLPSETAVGRVALTVTDCDRATEFYTETVGLAVRTRDDDRVVLGDGETPLLELHADPDAPERGANETGLYHFAVRVPSRTALGAALERIERTARLDGASDHHVSEALYLTDPEGNGVEIYRDRPRTQWEEHDDGTVRMGTDRLDRAGVEGASDGASSVPVGTDIGHVHLEVADLDATRSFYADGLGMTLRATAPGACFFAAGSYHHHVGANVWHARSGPGEGRGVAWYELRVPEGALEEVRRRLSESGYDSESAGEGFVTTDPAGIRVRIQPSR